jgi:Bifunctional DNA primase/polymerase, N-terminal/Primase C terminal 1 (PriCT-1)
MPFLEAQKAYAKHGIPLFPVRITADGAKRPSVRNYQRIGVRGSAKLVRQFGDAPAFGFVCGSGNKITVLDVDSSDETVLSDAIDRHGKSPLIVRTARRRFQAWYRWNGERRLIRPNPATPIDILGSGVVVAPNSSAAHGQYEIIQGSLEDLERLPPLASPGNSSISNMTVGTGRNNVLFRKIASDAHYCDDFDALLDRAKTLNDQFGEPLDDAEVVRTAKSVWKMTVEGRNRFGQIGAWLPLGLVDRLVHDPHLCTLVSWLKAHNKPNATFLVADGLRQSFGWPRRQFVQARYRAIVEGMIVQISEPRKGHPAKYVWGPAVQKDGPEESHKEITHVYIEDCLPDLVGQTQLPQTRVP